jgi:hypothetical protein
LASRSSVSRKLAISPPLLNVCARRLDRREAPGILTFL